MVNIYLSVSAHPDDGLGYETTGDRGLPQWTAGRNPSSQSFSHKFTRWRAHRSLMGGGGVA